MGSIDPYVHWSKVVNSTRSAVEKMSISEINKFSNELSVISRRLRIGISQHSQYPRRERAHDSSAECELLEGDNLEWLLRLLMDKEQFDFCYIDPPYNTGQQFVYPDLFSATEEDGLWGRHLGWMEFMLPRLVASHGLLMDTGIMAISIDDYEYANLKLLMDAIFGEDNYIATLVIMRSKNGKGSKPHVAVNHEYVCLYAKSSSAKVLGLHETDDAGYDKADEHGHFKLDGLFRKKGDASLRSDRPNMYFPLYYSSDGKVYASPERPDLLVAWPKDSDGVERRWLWGLEKTRADSWMLHASRSGVIYVKNYNSAGKRVKLRSVLDRPEYLTDRATTEIKAIYGEKVFETPKPIALIRDLIDCCCPAEGSILDFFAGTGTTAEAAHELNLRDGARRRTILIEQDIPIPKSHIAKSHGYERVSDITRRRLIHLGERSKAFLFS